MNIAAAICAVAKHGGSIPTIVALVMCFATIIVICLYFSESEAVPTAEDALEANTEFEIVGAYPEIKDVVLMITKVFDIVLGDETAQSYIAVRIRKGAVMPRVGECFHVDEFGHVFIDGTKAQVMATMGVRS